MTLGHLFKEAAIRVRNGETDAGPLIFEYTKEIEADKAMRHEAVRQLVYKRITDLISAHLKPSGTLPRVPAGQMSWLGMDPTLALTKMRAYIRDAGTRKARADRDAAVVGYIDASGLEPSNYETLGDLCIAAGVPDEYVAYLAA